MAAWAEGPQESSQVTWWLLPQNQQQPAPPRASAAPTKGPERPHVQGSGVSPQVYPYAAPAFSHWAFRPACWGHKTPGGWETCTLIFTECEDSGHPGQDPGLPGHGGVWASEFPTLRWTWLPSLCSSVSYRCGCYCLDRALDCPLVLPSAGGAKGSGISPGHVAPPKLLSQPSLAASPPSQERPPSISRELLQRPRYVPCQVTEAPSSPAPSG